VLSVTREIGGQALETERLTASDHFGGVELLQGGNRLSRVSALTGAVVYCLHSDALLKLAERRPAFKEDMRQGLAAMRAMEAKLVEQWDIARSPPGMHENWLLRLKHLHVPFVESEEQDG